MSHNLRIVSVVGSLYDLEYYYIFPNVVLSFQWLCVDLTA